MREWTREERYRVLKDASEIRGLYDSIKKSRYRQTYHIQAMNRSPRTPLIIKMPSPLMINKTIGITG